MVIIGFSCSYEPLVNAPVETPTGPISFASDIEPIFADQNCTSCHPSTAQLDLTAGNAYASIMAGRVDIENPESSEIYAKASPDGSHPAKYTNQQALYVLTWINEGALDN